MGNLNVGTMLRESSKIYFIETKNACYVYIKNAKYVKEKMPNEYRQVPRVY